MTYVMSDIHGYYDKYMAMLEQINFSDEDTLIINGDVADRGPDGIKIFQDIMKRKNVIMTMGNHETFILNTILAENVAIAERQIDLWFWNGGEPTFKAFAELPDEEKAEMIEFISNLPISIDLTVGDKKFYIVHGFPDNEPYDAVWNRPAMNDKSPLVDDNVQLIIGHTPVINFRCKNDLEWDREIQIMRREKKHMEILHAPHFIDTDCGCGQNIPGVSKLACIRLDDMKEFYV